eukprot:2633956-Rhodomonas_salina.1
MLPRALRSVRRVRRRAPTPGTPIRTHQDQHVLIVPTGTAIRVRLLREAEQDTPQSSGSHQHHRRPPAPLIPSTMLRV